MDDFNILGIGSNIGSGAIATIVTLAVLKWRMDRLDADRAQRKIDVDKKHEEIENKIEKLFDFKDSHEKEASQERLLLHQNVSKLEGILEFRGRENVEIMKRIEKIDQNVEQMKEDLAYLKVADKKHND